MTWPPSATGPTMSVRIFNALIDTLKTEGLGWHHADCSHAEASGTKLIKTLSAALQFAIPFDLKGALSRRAIYIPQRFKADSLQVSTPLL